MRWHHHSVWKSHPEPTSYMHAIDDIYGHVPGWCESTMKLLTGDSPADFLLRYYHILDLLDKKINHASKTLAKGGVVEKKKTSMERTFFFLKCLPRSDTHHESGGHLGGLIWWGTVWCGGQTHQGPPTTKLNKPFSGSREDSRFFDCRKDCSRELTEHCLSVLLWRPALSAFCLSDIQNSFSSVSSEYNLIDFIYKCQSLNETDYDISIHTACLLSIVNNDTWWEFLWQSLLFDVIVSQTRSATSFMPNLYNSGLSGFMVKPCSSDVTRFILDLDLLN